MVGAAVPVGAGAGSPPAGCDGAAVAGGWEPRVVRPLADVAEGATPPRREGGGTDAVPRAGAAATLVTGGSVTGPAAAGCCGADPPAPVPDVIGAADVSGVVVGRGVGCGGIVVTCAAWPKGGSAPPRPKKTYPPIPRITTAAAAPAMSAIGVPLLGAGTAATGSAAAARSPFAAAGAPFAAGAAAAAAAILTVAPSAAGDTFALDFPDSGPPACRIALASAAPVG